MLRLANSLPASKPSIASIWCRDIVTVAEVSRYIYNECCIVDKSGDTRESKANASSPESETRLAHVVGSNEDREKAVEIETLAHALSPVSRCRAKIAADEESSFIIIDYAKRTLSSENLSRISETPFKLIAA